MCGRFTLRTPAAQLIQIFHVPTVPELAPRYNIAPTQKILVVRNEAKSDKQREAVMMRWGLIPFWAKDMTIGSKMFNARSETVAEKPAFRNAFAKRRCLIVCDGFYEWQKLSTGKKQPWLMQMDEQQPFAMAGLWETWTPKEAAGDTEPLISCTILTTEANTDMRPLHDRMPVILPIEAWATWLSHKPTVGQLSEMLQPLSNGVLRKICVSPVVNRPVPDNLNCITPMEPPEPLEAQSL